MGVWVGALISVKDQSEPMDSSASPPRIFGLFPPAQVSAFGSAGTFLQSLTQSVRFLRARLGRGLRLFLRRGRWATFVRPGKWFAPDAGNPSGSRYFTVPAALGTQYRENNKHQDEKARSHPLTSAHRHTLPSVADSSCVTLILFDPNTAHHHETDKSRSRQGHCVLPGAHTEAYANALNQNNNSAGSAARGR